MNDEQAERLTQPEAPALDAFSRVILTLALLGAALATGYLLPRLAEAEWVFFSL